MFGDEKTFLNVPMSVIKTKSAFIPSESKRKGYRISVRRGKVVVTRQSLLQSIAGVTAQHRSVGRLSELRQTDGAVVIPGIVTMKLLQKIFLSVWFGVIAAIIFLSLVWAMFLAGSSMVTFFSEPAPFDRLAAIGFMLGGGTLVAVFGILLLTVMRLISRGERRKLIEFCEGIKGDAMAF